MATSKPSKRRHAVELTAATAFGVAGAGLLKVLGADGAAGTMLAVGLGAAIVLVLVLLVAFAQGRRP